MNAMRTRGFSIIEMIIALTIMGIIAAIGSVSLLGARKNSSVREGVATVAAALRQARSETQRYNADTIFAIGSGGTSYTLTRSGTTRTFNLPTSTYLETAISTIPTVTYKAPYGEVAQTGAAFCVSLVAVCTNSNAFGYKVNLGVVGLSGKVVIYGQ